MCPPLLKALTIKERINPKLHKQNLPRKYWKYLREKQDIKVNEH